MNPDEGVTYEILAAYFTHVIYNKLYPVADTYKVEGKYTTRLEAFKNVVMRYADSFKTEKNFNILISELHSYHIEKKKLAALSINDYIIIVSNIFIPNEYKKHFNMKNRVKLMYKALTNCINMYVAKVCEPRMLTNIIENDIIHTRNTRTFQNLFIELLKIQRDKYHITFNNRSLGITNDTQVHEEQLSKVIKELARVNAENTHLKKCYEKLKGDFTKLQMKYRELLTKHVSQAPSVVEKHESEFSLGQGNNLIDQVIEKLQEEQINEGDIGGTIDDLIESEDEVEEEEERQRTETPRIRKKINFDS